MRRWREGNLTEERGEVNGSEQGWDDSAEEIQVGVSHLQTRYQHTCAIDRCAQAMIRSQEGVTRMRNVIMEYVWITDHIVSIWTEPVICDCPAITTIIHITANDEDQYRLADEAC